MLNILDIKMMVLRRLASSAIILAIVTSGKLVECSPKSEVSLLIYCPEAGKFMLFTSTI